jgi:hypothetical protein
MDFLKFQDWNAVLALVAILGISLAMWQFGYGYVRKESLVKSALAAKQATVVLASMNKIMGFIGYMAFTLMIIALLWFGVGVVYTLVQFYGLQNKDIKPEIVNFCIAVIAAFVITLILRLIAAYRDKKTKAQQPVGESDVPIESKSKTLSRLIGMLEQNNENISKVIGLMNDEAKNE